MLTYVILSVLVLVMLLVVYIASRPSTFTVRRSKLILAPPEKIAAHVEDFRAWTAWSPWEEIDPRSTRTYSVVTNGVGATYRWAGNNKVGEGIMTITEVRSHQHLGIDLEFIKPMAAKNHVTFDFTAKDGGTMVTWAMSGRSPFKLKAMSMFINCDKMIGDQYEKGLSRLKSISEQASQPATT